MVHLFYYLALGFFASFIIKRWLELCRSIFQYEYEPCDYLTTKDVTARSESTSSPVNNVAPRTVYYPLQYNLYWNDNH